MPRGGGVQEQGGKVYFSGDVEIDANRVVIRRAGAECSLRPKTFRLLLYLLEHRDRLVPKEELIQELWPDTAVSDGALAQCIADLRRTLEEDSRNPRFIRTAPRLGYQFIAPVTEHPVDSVVVEEITEERIEYSEEISEDEPALLTAPVVRRRWMFITATVLIAIALAAWHYRAGRAPVAADSAIRIAIVPFENRSGTPDIDWLRTGVADMLATTLSASPHMALIPPAQMQR